MSEIEKNLKQIMDSMLPQALEEALKETGEMLTQEAKGNSPVVTGDLRNSINYKVEKNGVFIGSGLPYASVVHHGAGARTPQPFLQDAIDQNMDKILQNFENKLGGK